MAMLCPARTAHESLSHAWLTRQTWSTQGAIQRQSNESWKCWDVVHLIFQRNCQFTSKWISLCTQSHRDELNLHSYFAQQVWFLGSKASTWTFNHMNLKSKQKSLIKPLQEHCNIWKRILRRNTKNLLSLSFNNSPSNKKWSIAQPGSKISVNCAKLDAKKQRARMKKQQLCILKEAMSRTACHW